MVKISLLFFSNCRNKLAVTDRGNPGNIASVYSGTSTDFTNSDPVIYRPPLFRQPDMSGSAPDYRLLRTEQDSRWLNGESDVFCCYAACKPT